MKRLYYIVIPVMLILLAGCAKEGEMPSIYLTQYDIESLYFKDTTLVYNFNGDPYTDFTATLAWHFDTSAYNYTLEKDFYLAFDNLWDIRHACSETNTSEDREWEIGDTVTGSDHADWWSANSGGSKFSVSNADTFHTYLDHLKNHDVYWAFYLESGGEIHYGWIRLRCDLFAEIAFNMNPGEPILIGQRE